MFKTDKFDLDEDEAEALGSSFLAMCAEYDYVPSGKGLAAFTFIGTFVAIEMGKVRAVRDELKKRREAQNKPAGLGHNGGPPLTEAPPKPPVQELPNVFSSGAG
jgi:hypothetical protein